MARTCHCRQALRATPLSALQLGTRIPRQGNVQQSDRGVREGACDRAGLSVCDEGVGGAAVAVAVKKAISCQPHSANKARGMSTTLARRYSPTLLACGSLRVEAATPSPRRPQTTKLMLRRFGNR